jgi:hypothetical protein
MKRVAIYCAYDQLPDKIGEARRSNNDGPYNNYDFRPVRRAAMHTRLRFPSRVSYPNGLNLFPRCVSLVLRTQRRQRYKEAGDLDTRDEQQQISRRVVKAKQGFGCVTTHIRESNSPGCYAIRMAPQGSGGLYESLLLPTGKCFRIHHRADC